MKKQVKVIIAIVLSVWIFVMGFELGSYREKKKTNENTTQAVVTVAPTTAATTAPVTVPTETTAPTSSSSDNSTTPSTTGADNQSTSADASTTKAPAADSADPSALTKEQVLEKAAAAMKAVKNNTGDMKANHVEKINVTVTDCSVSSLVKTINSVVTRLVGDGDNDTYNFVGGQAIGVDKDGKNLQESPVTPNQVIPPRDKDFALPAEGATEATAKKDGDNTVYTLKVVAETASLENAAPQYNSNCCGYLDVGSLDIQVATVTQADLQYPGSTITITVDSQGRVIEAHFQMPMTGNGAAKAAFITGSAAFEGALDETWTFTY